MTTAADHPTRLLLLDAGAELGASRGLASVSVNNVVEKADVAKGTFYVHFKDRTDYLVSLHRLFHDRLFAAVSQATVGLPPGSDRLRRSIDAYLNGCTDERLTRAILFDAHFESAIRAEVALRNAAAAKPISADLRAMGVASPQQTARLVIAVTVHVAIAEQEAERPQRSLRAALYDLLKLDPRQLPA